MLYKQDIADAIAERCLEYCVGPENLMYGKMVGTRYSRQYYLSRILYDRNIRYKIGHCFVQLVEEHIQTWNFQLAGRDWSAIPLLIGLQEHVSHYHNKEINAFMIKRERKNYGIHNYIEGGWDAKPVLLVDDVCNSTNSFWHCHGVIKADLPDIEILPKIFAVLNKTGATHDVYLRSHECFSICNGADVQYALRNARPRSQFVENVYRSEVSISSESGDTILPKA